MKKRILVGALVAGLAAVAPRAGAQDPIPPGPADRAEPQFGHEHAAKIREEIQLHEQRARELDPIIARDRQARRDVEVDWVVLERHARDLHERANDFRAYANEQMSPRAHADMMGFANELDQFAVRDEDNARGQHDMAARLDHAIEAGSATREWHLRIAQRLRDWIGSNGY